MAEEFNAWAVVDGELVRCQLLGVAKGAVDLPALRVRLENGSRVVIERRNYHRDEITALQRLCEVLVVQGKELERQQSHQQHRLVRAWSRLSALLADSRESETEEVEVGNGSR